MLSTMLTVKLEDLADRLLTPDMHRYWVMALSRSMMSAVGTTLRKPVSAEVGGKEVEETSVVDRDGDVMARFTSSGRIDDTVVAK